MSITIYTKPACVQCTATKKAFDKQGIAYNLVDITEDPAARDYVMSLGYLFSLGFATVSMADQRIVGAPDAGRCAVRRSIAALTRRGNPVAR